MPKASTVFSQDKRFELGPIKCPDKNCNMTVNSAFCLKGHKSFVCKREHQCNEFGSVMTIGGKTNKKNKAVLMQNHNCSIKSSNVCLITTPEMYVEYILSQ